MNVILLSGGSGKRLWPLSNDTLSKQFLKLLKNGRGEYESMIQRVAGQIRAAHPDVDLIISTNLSQADSLRRQLGDVETILEPAKRDTFPAISLAAAYLYYQKGLSKDEVFLVCPVDPFAEEKYFQLLSEVEGLVTSGNYEIGLLGVLPTYPSEKYGYILQNKNKVTGFIEKPPEQDAKDLISGGALWNCGVFALTVGYALRVARKHIDFDSYESIYEQYQMLPQISFDYEVVEKEKSIACITYDGVWKDLGTWNTLTEEMSESVMGDGVLLSETCQNTHVLNMLNIPIIAQDLKDIVVVASYDGILVTSKHGSSYLKPLAEQINLRPMYGQKRWGNYRVLDYKQSDKTFSLIKRMHIESGKSINCHYHEKSSEICVVVSGKGILTLDGVDSVVAPGSMVHIPSGASHSLLAASDLEVIEVQLSTGRKIADDNIVQMTE